MARYLNHAMTLLLFLIFFYLGAIRSVLDKLQLSQTELGVGMSLATFGSLVSIQLFSLRHNQDSPLLLGINIGGAIVPLFFTLYFIQQAAIPLASTLVLILLVSLVAYLMTRFERGHGLVIYIFGAVVTAALGALVVGSEHYLVQAYTAAVFGTLIGGDLLHLTQLDQLRARSSDAIFIGGGGLLDAIFMSGLLAMLTAESLVGLEPL